MNTTADAESGILERAITADNESWSPEAARAILAFRLADADLRCADELAAKARSGALTDEERQSLETYLHVGRLVEFMKAQALLSLRASDAAP
ncbi:MAG: hypothetical protein HYY23_18545 [Verrucomicrobia bacterium]|nr:hypothetical protein [Verrucomicrobiota bacterium]